MIFRLDSPKCVESCVPVGLGEHFAALLSSPNTSGRNTLVLREAGSEFEAWEDSGRLKSIVECCQTFWVVGICCFVIE